jgi:hypothetical protein
MTFEQMVAEMVEKKMNKGLSIEASVAELANDLKAQLISSGLYEELRAKAQAIARLTVPAVATVVEAGPIDRNSTIAAIKASLKARNMNFSVTGGRGTTWGWITIDLMPATYKAFANDPDAIRAASRTMRGYFGLEGSQYINIPAGNDYYREYMDRAAGRTPIKLGKPYWD